MLDQERLRVRLLAMSQFDPHSVDREATISQWKRAITSDDVEINQKFERMTTVKLEGYKKQFTV